MVLTVVISIMGVIVNQDRSRTSLAAHAAHPNTFSFSTSTNFLLLYATCGAKEIIHG